MKQLFIILTILFLFACNSGKYTYTWNEQLYDIKYLPVTEKEGNKLIKQFQKNTVYLYILQHDINGNCYMVIDKHSRYATKKVLWWDRQILRDRHYKRLLNNER